MPSPREKTYFPSSTGFNIEQFPFYWVARLDAMYRREMEKSLKKLNMDHSRWRVAMLLHVHKRLSITHIAEHALAKLPTVTKIVHRMRDEALVTLSPCKKDGRVTMVELTAQGAANVEQILAQTQKLFQRAFEGMTPAQIERTNASLANMFSNLEI